MGVEEKAAARASKDGSGHKYIGVREDVARYLFFLAVSPATLTTELAVEGVESFSFWFELVLVPFYRLPGELGVHLDEGHQKRVGQ